MPSLSKAYGIDQELAENGKWFEMPGGVQVKLRYWNSKKVSTAQRRIFSDLAKSCRGGVLDDEGRIKAMRETMAQAAVVEWNVTDENGRPAPPTREKLVESFEAFPDFYADCITRCQSAQHYDGPVSQEEQEGNSSRASATTSSTGVESSPEPTPIQMARREALSG